MAIGNTDETGYVDFEEARIQKKILDIYHDLLIKNLRNVKVIKWSRDGYSRRD